MADIHDIPAEFTGSHPVRRRRRRRWQALLAIIVALALAFGGVAVGVAVLIGPSVQAGAEQSLIGAWLACQ